MAKTLTITDNRTGKTYELPITDGTIRAMDLRTIKASEDDFGLMSYDPALKNTASCRSAITFIDGEKGVLRHRGYPVEQLAQQTTYLEVAYLLLHGELPTRSQLGSWTAEIADHTDLFEPFKAGMQAFRYDAHPMGRLVSMLGTLSTYYPGSKNVRDIEIRREHIINIIAKMPTLAAWSFRHARGEAYVHPNPELSYAGNFLAMLFQTGHTPYQPHPALERVMDALFILHADHEQNCSANAARAVGSSEADPYVCTAAATAALYGPLHGGANEAVLRMLDKIDDVKNVPSFIKGVKNGEGRLMGFGHRVYKNYDPRAVVIKTLASDVFEVTGRNPKLDIALELERIALEDEYFVSRKLFPNVDFYSGLIYQAIGFPVAMFPVLFAIPRAAGWLSQWQEMLMDKEQKIARPLQIYTGHGERPVPPIDQRD